MTFAELLAGVYEITKRPDRDAVTKSAIKTATLKAHRSEFYPKDLYEVGVEFDEDQGIQQLDPYTIVSNFRQLHYLRRTTGIYDLQGVPFTILDVGELLDEYGLQRVNVAYQAGRVINIYAEGSFQYALMGCYVNPIVQEATYSSWIADLYPEAIIFEAASLVLRTMRELEMATQYAGLAVIATATLQVDSFNTDEV